MRMPCVHIIATFDVSAVVMWHVMWHRRFQADYERVGHEDATRIYDTIINDILSLGVSYDGVETDFCYTEGFPVYTRRSNSQMYELMKECNLLTKSEQPMMSFQRTLYKHDVTHLKEIDGCSMKTKMSPIAKVGDTLCDVHTPKPSWMADDFFDYPTPKGLCELENNRHKRRIEVTDFETPLYSYMLKWYREMDKNYGSRIHNDLWIKEGLMRLQEDAKTHYGVPNTENTDLNAGMDFDSFGVEKQRKARRLKAFYER